MIRLRWEQPGGPFGGYTADFEPTPGLRLTVCVMPHYEKGPEHGKDFCYFFSQGPLRHSEWRCGYMSAADAKAAAEKEIESTYTHQEDDTP